MKKRKQSIGTEIFFLVFFIIFSLSIFDRPALGGNYKLEKGKGTPICEAYFTNLNSYSNYPYPMTCRREVNEKLGLLRKPSWKKIDAWKNRFLIKNVDKFLGLELSFGDAEKNPEEWERTLKWRIKIHAAEMFVAKTDINNDGINDNVLMYSIGHCGSSHFYGTPILVLNSKENAVDLKKSYPLLQNPEGGKSEYAGRWGYTMYDVFIYKNHVYFDRWSDQEDQRGILKLFKTMGDNTSELCELKYENK